MRERERESGGGRRREGGGKRKERHSLKSTGTSQHVY